MAYLKRDVDYGPSFYFYNDDNIRMISGKEHDILLICSNPNQNGYVQAYKASDLHHQ